MKQLYQIEITQKLTGFTYIPAESAAQAELAAQDQYADSMAPLPCMEEFEDRNFSAIPFDPPIRPLSLEDYKDMILGHAVSSKDGSSLFGTFYIPEDSGVTAIDNTTGDHWTQHFLSMGQAVAWLLGEKG